MCPLRTDHAAIKYPTNTKPGTKITELQVTLRYLTRLGLLGETAAHQCKARWCGPAQQRNGGWKCMKSSSVSWSLQVGRGGRRHHFITRASVACVDDILLCCKEGTTAQNHSTEKKHCSNVAAVGPTNRRPNQPIPLLLCIPLD